MPRNVVNATASPKVNIAYAGSLSGSQSRGQLEMLQAYNSRDTQRASVNREEPIVIPEKPVLNNELIVRYERQLSKNRFLKEFKLICNKEVPDWQKYGALYSTLATHIRLGGESKKD